MPTKNKLNNIDKELSVRNYFSGYQMSTVVEKESFFDKDLLSYSQITFNTMKNENERLSLPANKEWVSSEYSYNKVNSKLSLPAKKKVDQLIKNYFDLNKLKKGKKSKRVEIRLRRLSPNKIFVSKSEIRYSNNKVIVTIYTYNREKKYLSFKISKLSTNNSNRKEKKVFTNKSKSNKRNKKNRRKIKVRYKNNFIKKIRFVNLKSIRVMKKIKKIRKLLLKSLNWKKENFKVYEAKYYKNFLKKLYKKQMINLFYGKNLYFNNNKFNNWFLIGIKSLLANVYKKKVELNIVDLKYLHHNSDNFVNAVSIKLRNRNNRLLRVLKKAIKLVKIPLIGLPTINRPTSVFGSSFTSNSNRVLTETNIVSELKEDEGNNLNKSFFLSYIGTLSSAIARKKLNSFNHNILANKKLLDSILKTTKYKIVNGVRLEAAGRLSRRLTASRSVFKYRYKGSLKDIDSSYDKLSSTLSKGYAKPNVQQTSLSYKTRNGAFGLKGSVSAHTGTKKVVSLTATSPIMMTSF